MAGLDPTGKNWTDTEIDLIVSDYFAMLALDLKGEAFVKAHRNKELQRLTGRGKGSIEFKHQNISAVIARLGLPWLRWEMLGRHFICRRTNVDSQKSGQTLFVS